MMTTAMSNSLLEGRESTNILVSIVIPCRNEFEFIDKCLDSILANDYPHDQWEIVVVDGMSTDGTRDVVAKYITRFPFIRLIDNPKKTIPAALNIGLANSRGEYIIRMDAHSIYDRSYVSKCIKSMTEYGADNMGGIWRILPRKNTVMGRAIARVLSSPLGAGDAHYKTVRDTVPKEVDTVPFGCYRRTVLEAIGGWDERMVRSEDVDVNRRIAKGGGKILLVPTIVAYYYARSNYWQFVRHNFLNGIWITYPLKFGKFPFAPRHCVPLVFVGTLIVLTCLSLLVPFFRVLLATLVMLYLMLITWFSLSISKKEGDWRYAVTLPIAFVGLHIPYGLGSLYGLLRIPFGA